MRFGSQGGNALSMLPSKAWWLLFRRVVLTSVLALVPTLLLGWSGGRRRHCQRTCSKFIHPRSSQRRVGSRGDISDIFKTATSPKPVELLRAMWQTKVCSRKWSCRHYSAPPWRLNSTKAMKCLPQGHRRGAHCSTTTSSGDGGRE